MFSLRFISGCRIFAGGGVSTYNIMYYTNFTALIDEVFVYRLVRWLFLRVIKMIMKKRGRGEWVGVVFGWEKVQLLTNWCQFGCAIRPFPFPPRCLHFYPRYCLGSDLHATLRY